MSTNEIKGKVYSPLAIDKTLTQEYMCADAKATGDAINEVNGKIGDIGEKVDEIGEYIPFGATVLSSDNKPTGSYIGNGSATAREIDIGGIGGVLLVYSDNAGDCNICLITKVSGVAFRTTGEQVTKYMSKAVSFKEGKLYLGTADNTVNANGVSYFYQVL